MSATQTITAQDNMFQIRSGKNLAFDSIEGLPSGPGNTIELSIRPRSNVVLKKAGEFQSLAMAGSTSDLKFAIVLSCDPESGQAKIGVVSDFADVESESSFALLTKVDANGDSSDLKIERGKAYHFAFVMADDPSTIDVFLDGYPQGAITCSIPAIENPKIPLILGGRPDVVNATPFDGEIGSLRIWNRALPEQSVIALSKFGRSCESSELSMLLEYGNLVAYGDFRGKTAADCKIVQPNRWLGGVWRDELASVKSDVDGNGTFLDFPVYSFLPESGDTFQVYEDFAYIGKMKSTSSERKNWQFQHVDAGWPSIDFEMTEISKSGRPTNRLVCNLLPRDIPRAFAGKKNGSVVLVRGTLDEDGAGISAQKFFSKLENDRRKAANEMSAAYLLGNNLRYKNVLYRGYNVARMDKFNLFDNGVNRTNNYLLAPPEQGLFAVDVDQIRIIPTDLSINNANMGIASSQSYYVADASEYSQVVTSRMGAGLNTSFTIGTGTASGAAISKSMTFSLNVVLQAENTSELQTMDTSSQDKMISITTFKHYDLIHKKEVERLDPQFRNALLGLYSQAKKMSPADREELLFQLFEEWGTHFVFGGSFGAIKWAERTVDESTAQSINRQSWNQYISINEGKTGTEGSFSNSITETLRSISETTKTLGGNSVGDANTPAGPGDEPAPISLDFRFMSNLCSPQFFPENPGIYNELRAWLDLAYPRYLKHVVAEQLRKQTPSPEFAKKANKFLETGEWSELEPKLFQVKVMSSEVDVYSAISGAKLKGKDRAAIESISLNVNFESSEGKSRYSFFSPKDKPVEFQISTSENAFHFVPFEPQPNEVIKVKLGGSIGYKDKGSVKFLNLAKVAEARPVDCEFSFDPLAKLTEDRRAMIEKWANSLVEYDSGTASLAALESSRERVFCFTQLGDQAKTQQVTHVLGPFVSQGSVPLCYLAVAANYQLSRVPTTNSIWANMAVSSKSAIKSTDGRFGAFLSPDGKPPVDLLSNRSVNEFQSSPNPAMDVPVIRGVSK